MRLLLSAALLLASLAGACKHRDLARVESVSLPVTSTRNQGSTGFCWAYVTAAYLEQEQLASGAEPVRLSAEYLGLWHMVDQMTLGQELEDGELVKNALQVLIPEHGLVPESAFHARFDLGVTKLAPLLKPAVEAFLRAKNRSDRRLAKAEALSLVKDTLHLAADLPDADAAFTLDGKTFTPLTFARDRLHFDAAAYVPLALADAEAEPEQFAQQMQLIKKSLLLGHGVPLNLALFDVPKDGGDWRCDGCGPAGFSGFHVVLAVDYASASSPFGFQETAALQAAFAEPVTAWLTKNSFGMGIYRGSSTRPEVLARDPFPAFAVVDAGYLRAGTALDALQAIVPAAVVDAEIDWERVRNAPLAARAGGPAAFSADKTISKTGPVSLIQPPPPADAGAVFARDGATLPLGPGGAPPLVCMAFAVTSPAVKAIAIYRPQVSTSPYMVVDDGSDWVICIVEALGFHKLVAQALDENQHVVQSIPIGFTVVAGAARPAPAPAPGGAPKSAPQASLDAARAKAGDLGDSADRD